MSAPLSSSPPSSPKNTDRKTKCVQYRTALLRNLEELKQLDKDIDDVVNFAVSSFEQERDKRHLFNQLQLYVPDRMKVCVYF
jgi:hypothetical protein